MMVVHLFIYFYWRLINLQYCSGFCHTLTWISHWYICVPYSEPLSHSLPSQSWFKLVIHPAWHFTWMYSKYKLNKQGNNIQLWRTPFPNWNRSAVPCVALTVASWPAYRFPRRQVRWTGIPISLRIFHSLLWFISSKDLVSIRKHR